jgi:hypothetical protein
MSNFELLIFNLKNPTRLFFLLGVLAKLVKSDLEFPAIIMGVTFPFNNTIGMPLFLQIIHG